MEVQIPKDLTRVLVSFHAAGQPGAQVGGNVPVLQEQPGQHAIKGGRGIVQPMVMYDGADVNSDARLSLKPMGTDEVQQSGLAGVEWGFRGSFWFAHKFLSDRSGTCGNHGRGTEEVDGVSKGGVGGRITGTSAPDRLPQVGVGPPRPSRQKPGHNLAKAAPLPVP